MRVNVITSFQLYKYIYNIEKNRNTNLHISVSFRLFKYMCVYVSVVSDN